MRRASRDDLEPVASVEAEALGSDAWSSALLRAGLVGDLPTVRYLVAVDRAHGAVESLGEVVGHAVASLADGAGGVAELQRIGVRARHRRRGVATALLVAVEAEAAAVGSARMLLEVREDNTGALGFYAAHGFVEVSRRRRYYADGATAVVLQRPVPYAPSSS